MLKNYIISYLITNAFSTFVIYLFFESALTKKKIVCSNTICFFIYFLFYITVSFAYLHKAPQTVVLAVNIIGLLLISLIYEGKPIQKLVLCFSIYGILMAIEVIIYWIYHNVNYIDPMLEKYDFSIVLATVVDILSFLAVLLYKLFHDKAKSYYMPDSYWFTLLGFPTFILIITYVFSKNGVDTSSDVTIICFALILVINVVVFILFDLLNNKYNYKIEKILFENNINHYLSQISMISESETKSRQINHNINNHLQCLLGLLNQNDIEGSKSYLTGLVKSVNKSHLIMTGNNAIDSMINYKAGIIEEKKFDFITDVHIPEKLNISQIDITTLLGNLFDNAIEAVENINDNRFIALYIKYDKSNIFITMKNTFSGEMIVENGKYKTLKKDKKNHGIGLKSVYQIVERYNGLIRINTDNNVFTVNILLYL